MPIHYDITKDGLYLEGLQIGRQEAQQAIKKVREDAKENLLKIITGLLQESGMTVDGIARITSVSPDYVRKVRTRLSKDQ